MANADVVKLLAVLELKDLFSDKISRAERNLSKFESRSTKAGRQIGLGILRGAAIAATGVTAAVGVMGKAVFAASDLNETVSKTGIVFKKNAGDVLAFGKTSAASLGLSENAADSAAATYGNLFVSLGLATSKAAPMSIAMVKLAGDLASFNNASPEDTLLAIQSGLVGETEPLRKYGISLNDATLRQEAMALGLTKTTKEVLPPAVKAQAAYSLILKQSGTAQGDFARTSDGLANQIRILKANFTDMLATLGTPVLPQVAKVFKQINVEIKANQPEIAKLGDAVAALFSDENIKSGADILKGAFQTAKETAPIVASSAKATFGLVQAAVGLFKSLPPELQKLAVGAFAVNKLTGGLVTNIAGGVFDKIGEKFFSRGSPTNPLFVSDVSLGKGVGAGGVVSKGGGLVNAIGKVFLVGAAVGVFAELAGILGDQSKANRELVDGLDAQTKTFTGGASLADLRKSLAGLDQQFADLQGFKNIPASLAFSANVDGVRDAMNKARADIVAAIQAQGGTGLAPGVGDIGTALTAAVNNAKLTKTGEDAALAARRIEAAENRVERATTAAGTKTAAHLSALGTKFGHDIHSLEKATKPFDAVKFAKALAADVTKGAGSVKGTERAISDINAQLTKTDDPKTRSALTAALHAIQAKLPNRQKVDAQIAEAKKIVKSTDSSGHKIADLKTIESALRREGNTHAASTIRKMEQTITATKKVSADTRSEGAGIRRAVNEKDLSVRVNITNNTTVSLRGITLAQTRARALGFTVSSPTRITAN